MRNVRAARLRSGALVLRLAGGAPDKEILDHAAQHGFVLVKHDLDFGAILAVTRGMKPSVVQLRDDDISPESGADAMVAALTLCAAELDKGALLTIDSGRARLTLLPLGE